VARKPAFDAAEIAREQRLARLTGGSHEASSRKMNGVTKQEITHRRAGGNNRERRQLWNGLDRQYDPIDSYINRLKRKLTKCRT